MTTAALEQPRRAAAGGSELLLEVKEAKLGMLERLTGRRRRPSDLRARRRDDEDWDDDWTDYDWSPSTGSDSSTRAIAAAAAGAAAAAAVSAAAAGESAAEQEGESDEAAAGEAAGESGVTAETTY